MNFRGWLREEKIIVFDGGMGTLLQAQGMAPGELPEIFGLSHPKIIEDIHRAYVTAGANVLTTNTFGGNKFKLPAGVDVFELNRKMALLAKKAGQTQAMVAGSVGPTGKMLRPLGDVDFMDLVLAFAEQIKGLVAGGVDLILGETHFDLGEARAVVVACRKVAPNVPVAISMTFEGSSSLTGTTPSGFVLSMLNLNVDLIATNCSLGPSELTPVVEEMLQVSTKPVLVEPNAGLPVLENGKTVFKLKPEPFAKQMLELAQKGVKCLGGCCGTTPDHIRALTKVLQAHAQSFGPPQVRSAFALTSRDKYVCFGQEHPFVLIGERINPTGKKKLTQELQAGELNLALTLAKEQLDAGAKVLDVNVGAPLVQEEEVLPRLGFELVKRFDAVLCFDSTNLLALEKSLQIYPGSPLINSISGEKGKLERLGPLCRDYGAPFILLPLEDNTLPETAAKRIAIIESILDRCEQLNIPRRLILVDVLALTVSSTPEAAKACFEVIKYCQKWGLPTTVGLSNVSFGLPARELLNATFLSMAMGIGLTSCIVNPNLTRIQEVIYAANVLLNKDKQAKNFIQLFAKWKSDGANIGSFGGEQEIKTPQQAVILGDKKKLLQLLAEEVKTKNAFEILNQELIPAITEVGKKYEKKEYFLPQLLLSAEAMQAGVKFLEPWLKQEQGERKGPKIVMATVEGDIHDIGKNIVCLLLQNHGFEVIDLGKDVPAEKIVETAQEQGAELIGLSALMTTTMVRMEDTVRLVNQKGLKTKIIVGGAVVTKAFAEKIGAHGYAEDAVEAVRVAKELLSQNKS